MPYVGCRKFHELPDVGFMTFPDYGAVFTSAGPENYIFPENKCLRPEVDAGRWGVLVPESE
jgi:hypothetical protein